MLDVDFPVLPAVRAACLAGVVVLTGLPVAAQVPAPTPAPLAPTAAPAAVPSAAPSAAPAAPRPAAPRPGVPASAPKPGARPAAARPGAPAGATRGTGTLRLETGAKGASVLIDGSPVGVAPLPGPWTLPVGNHVVELRLSGQAPVRAQVAVAAGRESRVQLAAEVVPEAPAKVSAAPLERVIYSGPGFSLATAGYITAGVGAAASITGALFGVMANSKADQASKLDRANPGNTRADQQALVDAADRAAVLSNVTLGVGGAAVVAGVALILLASDGPLGTAATGPGPGGFVLGGHF